MLFSSPRTSTEKLTLSASRGGIGKKSRTLSKGRDLPETLSQAEKTTLFVNHESSFYWTVRSVELRRKFAHFVWGVGWYSEPPKHFCFLIKVTLINGCIIQKLNMEGRFCRRGWYSHVTQLFSDMIAVLSQYISLSRTHLQNPANQSLTALASSLPSNTYIRI